MKPRFWLPATCSAVFAVACASTPDSPAKSAPPASTPKSAPPDSTAPKEETIAESSDADSPCDAQSRTIAVGDFTVVHFCGDPRYFRYDVTPEGILEEKEIWKACRLGFVGRQRGRARVKLWRTRETAGMPPDRTFCIDVE